MHLIKIFLSPKQKLFSFIIILMMGMPQVHAANVKVVATFSILGDIVANVGGDHIDLVTLVGADGDAHDYEPTPKDTILLGKSDIIFENGLHFEHWLDKLYTASGSKARRVVVSNGIIPRTIEEDGMKEEDPHAWQDVTNVMAYTQNVRDSLIAIDPAHQKEYESNAAAYIAQLKELDEWILAQTRTIGNKTIVTNHDALGYFAHRYNFNIVGAIIPSGTTEAADPSAKQIVALMKVIKRENVRVIFSENITNDKLAHMLAAQGGIKVASGIYSDALGGRNSNANTYIAMMKHNMKVFSKYLNGL